MLDCEVLTLVVGRALDRPVIEVVEWACDPFGGGYGAKTSGVFHIHGKACEADRPAILSWSVVLKVCRAEERGSDPAGWTFGPREALAYQSGLLSDLPAPRCFGVQEQADG